MKFTCTIGRGADRRWQARHQGSDLGTVIASGQSREEAVEKLRQELRYRLELCPCTGESYQHIEVEVVEG